MSVCVVWIDREKAKLFCFLNNVVEHKSNEITSSSYQSGDHTFFAKLVLLIPQTKRILVLGPCVAKHHFLNYLNEQTPRLARRVIGCEVHEHFSDQSIIHFAQQIISK